MSSRLILNNKLVAKDFNYEYNTLANNIGVLSLADRIKNNGIDYILQGILNKYSEALRLLNMMDMLHLQTDIISDSGSSYGQKMIAKIANYEIAYEYPELKSYKDLQNTYPAFFELKRGGLEIAPKLVYGNFLETIYKTY